MMIEMARVGDAGPGDGESELWRGGGGNVGESEGRGEDKYGSGVESAEELYSVLTSEDDSVMADAPLAISLPDEDTNEV
jgi:hypothetical protein